jgi:predicted flap endonuclease-1-like 5' DNA nuclease
MAEAPNRNVPWLGGWVIAAGMGLVAFGVAKVIGQFDWTPAVAIGGVVFLIAGLVTGMPWGASSAPAAPRAAAPQPAPAVATPAASAAPAAAPAPKPEAAAADPVVAAPAAAPAATPVALMAAPEKVAEAAPAKAPAARAKAAKAPAAKAKAPAEKAKAPAKPKVAKPKGPVILTAPRGGKADDLKVIEGIGPAMEKLVNGFGVFHYDQIAGWTDADVAVFDAKMDRFKGRITRDKWVAQAKIIVSEGLERFLERARTNDY